MHKSIAYMSTRGTGARFSFEDVLLEGLARDGGLFVPDTLPHFGAHIWADLEKLTYQHLAFRVMRLFIEGDCASDDELNAIIQKSYAHFHHPELLPLHQLKDGLFVAELFHGPTLAFKDFALQFLGHMFDHVLQKNRRHITIIGATSGDTGSAAIEAFKGKKNADIYILHPKGRVSEVQRRQMTTVSASNVYNIALEGSFDDCQDIVKALFQDDEARSHLNLSAINSINWARILAQIVYYIFIALKVHRQTSKPADFVVPTGNFGNIYAAYVAKEMGFPLGRLVIATNQNDILHRFTQTAEMKMCSVIPTLSPSMDIQISSNFERLLFDLLGRDPAKCRIVMQNFRKDGVMRVDAAKKALFDQNFASAMATDEDVLRVITQTYQQDHYMVDPHTASGLYAADALGLQQSVVMATAHPAKFPDAVFKALHKRPLLPDYVGDLYTRPERFKTMANEHGAVKAYMFFNHHAAGGQKHVGL
jgi:threonine synthase